MYPFEGKSSAADVRKRIYVRKVQKVLGDIIARALAYEKSVGFLVVRKIREP